jgi:hypothetical protein
MAPSIQPLTGALSVHVCISELEIIFQPEEYVTSSVLGKGVFDSPSLTLVIGANI